MKIEDVAANLNKKKEASKVEAPAPVAAPVAAQAEVPNEGMQILYKALIGLAPTLIGALAGGSAGGAAGAKAGAAGLDVYSAQDKEKAAKEKEKAEKVALASKELKQEQKDAAKFAFEKSKFAQEHSQKALELSVRQAEAIAKNEKPKPPTADQALSARFARRMEQAENIINKLAASGYDRTSLMGAVGSFVPSAIAPSASQEQEQAERNFINAILRDESGAAISPTEFASAEKQYFPRAGDSPQVIENKKANRQQAILGLQGEAGPVALSKVPLVDAPSKDLSGGLPEPMMKAIAGAMNSGNVAQAAPTMDIDMSSLDSMTTEELKKYLGK